MLHIGEREVRCIPLREPDADEHGCAAWLAVPAEDPGVLVPGVPVRLTAEHLPDGCILYPGLEQGLDTGAGTWQ